MTNFIIASSKSPNAEGAAITTLTFVSFIIEKYHIKFYIKNILYAHLFYNTKNLVGGIQKN